MRLATFAPTPRRAPPAGERIAVRVGPHPSAEGLASELARRHGALRADLVASGREALRRGLASLARRSGRDEVVVPAYTCPSVAAAAVAAGLRVRLVEVTPEGRIDPTQLAALPLSRCAAIVVCNLFGCAEPIAPLEAVARNAEVALVDDAAQSFGAVEPGGVAGARGALGVLSFARGKPLGAIGGGALLWHVPADEPAPDEPSGGSLRARIAARAHDLALDERVFPWLARAPLLHVGLTRFEPRFRHGAIDPAAACVTASLLHGADEVRRARARRLHCVARRIGRETPFRPLVPGSAERWAAPRLALLAPTPEARDAAVAALADRGAGRLYPESLDRMTALARHRTDDAEHPVARRLAATLLTLPPSLRARAEEEEERLVSLLLRAGSTPRSARTAEVPR